MYESHASLNYLASDHRNKSNENPYPDVDTEIVADGRPRTCRTCISCWYILVGSGLKSAREGKGYIVQTYCHALPWLT
jgi:hypothetical protein